MIPPKIQIRVEKSDFFPEYKLVILSRSSQETAIVTKYEFETFPEGQLINSSSMLSLSKETVQLLMDDLWRAGIRPTEQINTESKVGALENHLNDMRAIVKKNLGVDFK